MEIIEKFLDNECLVCQNPSKGMHFGANTCRACAAFFRRATLLNLQFECIKKNNNCSGDKKRRFICKSCRFSKCLEIGMTSKKVKIDYDPTLSMKQLFDDYYTTSEESNTSSLTNSPSFSISEEEAAENDMLFNFIPKSSKKPIAIIDFSDLTQKIEVIFDSKNEDDGKNEIFEKSSSIMIKINEMEIFDMINLLKNVIIIKWAQWINSIFCGKSIGKQQKMQLFRNSWNILHVFERLQITSKYEELLKTNSILISNNLLWICGKSHYNVSSISEITNRYFSKLFDPYLQRFIDEIGQKLYEIKISDQELKFCLIQLLGYDKNDLTQQTIEIIEELQDEIANEMHHFYSNDLKLTNYSCRLIKLLNIVKNMKKIMNEKNKIKELFYIFDIFHADISDNDFFDIF
ncbi:unnamed protein product [Caenorhabditis angaria]|uniref:Nuclear receptor domain-containing protein n=1 Tax=Caenorhabditis angaria TaxID=860376 RepID=A0A9P1IRX5_9PELO|nr:unnamed protein product [Caenorhabditis angaria]